MKSKPSGKPLTVLLPWLLSKKSHVEKYCAIYTKLGFEVVVIRMELFQLLRPKSGAHLIADDVVKFLTNNDQYKNIVVHGFSAGGYLWAESLKRMHVHEKFDSISKRVKCQVWDSVTGYTEIPIGISKSIFPGNKIIQNLMISLSEFYLKASYESATQFFQQGESYFNANPLTVPALIFASKTDPVGTERKAREIVDSFLAKNIDLTFKLFDKSPHVQHYHTHKEEYMKFLCEHLKKCQLLENTLKIHNVRTLPNDNNFSII